MKNIYISFMTVLALTACGETSTPAETKSPQAASQTTAAQVPTKKYADVQTMFADKNTYPPDDGSFVLIKESPPEFLISPAISAQDNQDSILSDYKYAALEGLLLPFAQTDIDQLTVHIQPRIINGAKPISESSRQAVTLRITLQAKREDLAAALHKMQIYDFDQLIDHGENPNVIAGSSQSQSYLNLRKNDVASWQLINSFRIDNNKI